MLVDVVGVHSDLQWYYRNMGFLDWSSPGDLLKHVVGPSMRPCRTPAAPKPRAPPGSEPAASTSDGSPTAPACS